jgi:hypothetical protein
VANDGIQEHSVMYPIDLLKVWDGEWDGGSGPELLTLRNRHDYRLSVRHLQRYTPALVMQ